MTAVLPAVVTVVIPVFNSATTLARAVASALEQTLAAFELLIVDDGSTDDSLAVANALARQDARIRVIAMPQNGGKARAMNHAAKLAAGDWVAVLDADDRYLPTPARHSGCGRRGAWRGSGGRQPASYR